MDDVGHMIERVRELRARRARLDAEELALLAKLSTAVGDDRCLAEELTPVLRVSTREAERRIDDGKSSVRRMPRLLDAMRAGELEAYGARRVLTVVDLLDDDAARNVDDLLAEKLADAPETAWQPGNVAQRVRRLVQKVDPGGHTARARRARAERHLELTPGEHAMSALAVSLPAEIAAACYSRVDALARSLRRDDDGRTLDQLRADVTADLLLGRDPGTAAPEAAAMISVHVPVDAALSISDEGCELDGYGPIPAPIAREIMTNERSIWRAVLCDPGTGEPVDLGRTRRRPSAAIRELVRVRDRECVMPWCHRPARHCDHDHEQAWAGGGATSVTNGGPRCRRHTERPTPRTANPSSLRNTLSRNTTIQHATIRHATIQHAAIRRTTAIRHATASPHARSRRHVTDHGTPLRHAGHRDAGQPQEGRHAITRRSPR